MDSIMSSVVADEDERPASSDAFWGVSPFTSPPKRLRLDSMPNGLEEFELQQENGAVEESFQMEERLDDASAELGLSMVSAIPSSNERVFDLLDELPDEDDDEGEEDDLESSEGEEISQEEIDQLLEKGSSSMHTYKNITRAGIVGFSRVFSLISFCLSYCQ